MFFYNYVILFSYCLGIGYRVRVEEWENGKWKIFLSGLAQFRPGTARTRPGLIFLGLFSSFVQNGRTSHNFTVRICLSFGRREQFQERPPTKIIKLCNNHFEKIIGFNA